MAFLQRFLQHVLPRGCMKVRYYGIWSPTCRRQFDQARALLTGPSSAGAHRIAATHAATVTRCLRAPADALSPVSNGALGSASASSLRNACVRHDRAFPRRLARSSRRALAACRRRRLSRRQMERVN